MLSVFIFAVLILFTSIIVRVCLYLTFFYVLYLLEDASVHNNETADVFKHLLFSYICK